MSKDEERLAWDRYAAAALSAMVGRTDMQQGRTQLAAEFADAMLKERRERFGDGGPDDDE